jgi:tetratricopeptide (TPR) repeat protein
VKTTRQHPDHLLKEETMDLSEDAAAVLAKRVASGTADKEDYRSLAAYLDRTGRLDEAATIYLDCLRLPLTVLQRAEVSRDLAFLLYKQGNFAGALELAHASLGSLASEPGTPGVLFERGLIEALIAHCLATGNLAGVHDAARTAADTLQQISESQDFATRGLIYARLADLYLLIEEPRKSVLAAEQALQHELPRRDRIACLITLAEGHRGLSRLTEALEHLDSAVGLVDSEPELRPLLYLTLGLVLRGLHRGSDARAAFAECLQAAQQITYVRSDKEFYRAAYGNLAELFYESKDYYKAIDAIRELLQTYPAGTPGRYRVLTWLGDCYVFIEDYVRAKQCFESVLNARDSEEDERREARAAMTTLSRRWKRLRH